MSRPIKWRKICCMPLNKTFAPSGSKPQGKITMTIDEYETIRLMDLENCTQENLRNGNECSQDHCSKNLRRSTL